MSEQERRDELIRWAKARATGVVSCVGAEVRPEHLLRDATWEQLAAMVIVLADAVNDHLRLAALARLPGGEGMPRPGHEEASDEVLKAAHARILELRLAGWPLPTRLALLENEYQRRRAKPRPSRGNGAQHAWLRRQAERSSA